MEYGTENFRKYGKFTCFNFCLNIGYKFCEWMPEPWVKIINVLEDGWLYNLAILTELWSEKRFQIFELI